jgi:site-specific DNA-methyltransferase (adenine-specific)
VDNYSRLHSSEKQFDLFEYLIKTYSDENDLVLDNTMGICLCGVACINTNLNFISIENDKYYFNISINRIKEDIKGNGIELIVSYE